MPGVQVGDVRLRHIEAARDKPFGAGTQQPEGTLVVRAPITISALLASSICGIASAG